MLEENMNLKNILCALASRPWFKTICSAAGVGRWRGGGGCRRSLTANCRELNPFISPLLKRHGLRTRGRWAARFNQPAMRLASNPDLQICKHCFHTSRFAQSSVKLRAQQFLVRLEIVAVRSKTNV